MPRCDSPYYEPVIDTPRLPHIELEMGDTCVWCGAEATRVDQRDGSTWCNRCHLHVISWGDSDYEPRELC